MIRGAALLMVMGVLLGGCFESKHARTTSQPPPRLRPAPAADVDVVRLWSELLDDGLVSQASDLFTVPSIAQNGGRAMRLRSRRAVVAFNASLPCGARLARSFARGRDVVAVFSLTDRPGGHCGISYGHEAATAFLIRGGMIARWRALNEPIPAGP